VYHTQAFCVDFAIARYTLLGQTFDTECTAGIGEGQVAPHLHQEQGKQRGYRVFLLRLWQASSDSGSGWRASLEDAHTQKRYGFASLNDLTAFLNDQCDDQTLISTIFTSEIQGDPQCQPLT
jgi:hypothetical protein